MWFLQLVEVYGGDGVWLQVGLGSQLVCVPFSSSSCWSLEGLCGRCATKKPKRTTTPLKGWDGDGTWMLVLTRLIGLPSRPEVTKVCLQESSLGYKQAGHNLPAAGSQSQTSDQRAHFDGVNSSTSLHAADTEPHQSPPTGRQQCTSSQSSLSWQHSVYYGFFVCLFFFPNSQPPKKFSTPPPISQREVVSYLFYLHLWGIKFNIVTTG